MYALSSSFEQNNSIFCNLYIYLLMVACWTVSLNWVSSTLKLSECLCTKAPHDEDWICPFLIVSWDVDIASPRQNSPFLSIQKLSKLLFDPNSIWLPFTVRLVIQTPFVPVDCNWNSVSALTASEERQYWKLLNLLFIMSFRSPSTLKKISLPSQFLADISFQSVSNLKRVSKLYACTFWFLFPN